jgi:hypothetical protein
MVEFVYLDETGADLGPSRRHPELLLAGVVVHESKVHRLREHLLNVADEFLEDIPKGFEFHGYDLWSGEGAWRGRPPEVRIGAYRRAIDALVSLDLWVAHSTVNKVRLHKRYDGQADGNSYRLALQFLLEKVDRIPGELRVVVADDSKEQSAAAIEMFTELQELGLGEVPGSQLNSYVDSLHFVRSQDSHGVQLADLVAFVLQRSRSGRDTHPGAVAAMRDLDDLIRRCTRTWRQSWPP